MLKISNTILLSYLSLFVSISYIDSILVSNINTNLNVKNSISIEWNYTESIEPLFYLIRVTDIFDNYLFSLNTLDNSNLLIKKNVISIPNLKLGEFYKFYFSSYDANEKYSEESAPLIAQVCSTPIYLFNESSNIFANVISESQIQIIFIVPSYNGGCLIEKYLIHYSDGNSNELNSFIEVTDVSNLSSIITISSYANKIGKLFFFQIEAFNSGGSAKTETISVILGRAPQDTPPALVININSSTENKICFDVPTLQVDYNAGGLEVVSFEIEVESSTLGYKAFLGTPPNYNALYFNCFDSIVAKKIINSEILIGKVYSFRYRIWNILGASPYSNISEYFVSIKPFIPLTPILVEQTPTTIKFSLSASYKFNGETTTTVLKGTTGANDSEEDLVSFDTLTHTYTLDKAAKNLEANKIYSFWLVSHNSKGNSPTSTVLNIKALGNNSEITDVIVTDFKPNLLRINWVVSNLVNTNIFGYFVYIDDLGNSNFKIIGEKFDKEDTTLKFIPSAFNRNIINVSDKINLKQGSRYNIKVVAKTLDKSSIIYNKLVQLCFKMSDLNSLQYVYKPNRIVVLFWHKPKQIGGCDIIKVSIIKEVDGVESTIILSSIEYTYTESFNEVDLGKTVYYYVKLENAVYSLNSNKITVKIQ